MDDREGGEKGSGVSVLMARHDDDDDEVRMLSYLIKMFCVKLLLVYLLLNKKKTQRISSKCANSIIFCQWFVVCISWRYWICRGQTTKEVTFIIAQYSGVSKTKMIFISNEILHLLHFQNILFTQPLRSDRIWH